MIKLVPHSLREGALALGAPQWRVTLGVVVPAAASGIATRAMLAIARISGETAPLLFTAIAVVFFSYYLDQPIASLTVPIIITTRFRRTTNGTRRRGPRRLF